MPSIRVFASCPDFGFSSWSHHFPAARDLISWYNSGCGRGWPSPHTSWCPAHISVVVLKVKWTVAHFTTSVDFYMDTHTFPYQGIHFFDFFSPFSFLIWGENSGTEKSKKSSPQNRFSSKISSKNSSFSYSKLKSWRLALHLCARTTIYSALASGNYLLIL